MKRSIRVRLTVWYAGVLAAILAVLGVFVVLRLGADLRAAIDRELLQNAVHIADGYADTGAEDFRDVSRKVLSRDGGVAQVLGPDGRVLHTYGFVVSRRQFVSPAAHADALAGAQRLLTVRIGPDRQRFRVVTTPVQRLGRRRVVVVAESLDRVEASVRRLAVLLLLACPVALAATTVGGWWLARKSLLAVARMTTQAEEIGIDRLDERIAVPSAVDEIGQLALTLNAMLDRLQAGVHEKHRLIADASHELRAPLAVMRTELDISLRGDDLSPDARSVLGNARDEVDRMSRTVDDLLALAEVDEGRLDLLMTQVELYEAVAAAARPFAALAANKGVRLEVGGERCDAQADPQRLRQVLSNYIENAIKYSQPGGKVSVTCWRSAEEVGVTVQDEGPGIPAAAVERVFDRFYRVDDGRGRNVRGTGLGLAICREIATAHGGRVWVESEEGKGSAFSLALPLVAHALALAGSQPPA
jgi:heavy metal sensor kinase